MVACELAARWLRLCVTTSCGAQLRSGCRHPPPEHPKQPAAIVLCRVQMHQQPMAMQDQRRHSVRQQTFQTAAGRAPSARTGMLCCHPHQCCSRCAEQQARQASSSSGTLQAAWPRTLEPASLQVQLPS